MPSIEEFVQANPSLSKEEPAAPPSADDLRLLVELIEITPEVVSFAYAGIAYSIARSRVSDISLLPQPHGPGSSSFRSPPYVILTISHNAQLNTIHSIAAADLVSAVPFSMLNQLEPIPCSTRPSEREKEWMSKTGYNTAALRDVGFSSNSGSMSGGAYDDSKLDDWCHPI